MELSAVDCHRRAMELEVDQTKWISTLILLSVRTAQDLCDSNSTEID